MSNNFWKISDKNIQPFDYDTKTISDTSRFTPVGAYTTFRTYNRFSVLRLTKHLDRLEETSRLAGYDIYLDRIWLKSVLVSLIEASSDGEKRIRITIDLEKEIGTLYIAMEPLVTPDKSLYQNGIVCLTTEAHRDNPKAKLSNFLEKADELRGLESEHYDEILMHTINGNILEGLSSNFYGVRGDIVYTAEEGVLSGTTRDFILQIAYKLEIPVEFTPVNLAEVPDLDESFISSTSRSILPIRSIDGNTMRKAVPGPVTKKLMDEFEAEIETRLESLKA